VTARAALMRAVSADPGPAMQAGPRRLRRHAGRRLTGPETGPELDDAPEALQALRAALPAAPCTGRNLPCPPP
jgi:hypothetical protein